MIVPKKECELLPPERKRSKQLKIWVSPEEQELIRQKMAEFGTDNMGAFVRKMVIDGYIVKLDLPELQEIIRLLGSIANNVNQIARRVNAGGNVYKEDLEDINANLDQNYKMLRKVMKSLSKIH
jgi:SepF-like predicted cell division protein (DUF552 family)